MENTAENENKTVNKAKSLHSGPQKTDKSEPVRRKSCNENEAVISLDLALGRLKKSKLVNGEYCTSAPVRPSGPATFIDMSRNPQLSPGIDNASLMSMNFSHYELMRNLSRSNCNSDGAFSGSTCNTHLNLADSTVKDEQLERFFRSAEIWTRTYRKGEPSGVHFEIPEK